MELNRTYFYTATILNWQYLLSNDKYKLIIIDSLKYLAKNNLLHVYGYVIMPNHMHLIWRLLKMNGKEMPHASFMKYTAHKFQEELRAEQQDLSGYFVGSSTRQYQFWERESLPIELFTEKIFKQKLEYIHLNPVRDKWKLSELPEEYAYSSAAYYEKGIDKFGIVTDYRY